MRRLIYTSTSYKMLSSRDLSAILSSSRRNNTRDGITGLLIYHEGCFLQVLEGPDDKLNACFERVRRDSRHHTFLKLMDEACASRLFSEWMMAYQELSDIPAAQQRQYLSIFKLAEKLEGDNIHDSPAMVMHLTAFLSGFRGLEFMSAA